LPPIALQTTTPPIVTVESPPLPDGELLVIDVPELACPPLPAAMVTTVPGVTAKLFLYPRPPPPPPPGLFVELPFQLADAPPPPPPTHKMLILVTLLGTVQLYEVEALSPAVLSPRKVIWDGNIETVGLVAKIVPDIEPERMLIAKLKSLTTAVREIVPVPLETVKDPELAPSLKLLPAAAVVQYNVLPLKEAAETVKVIASFLRADVVLTDTDTEDFP
jgi:hypothetical protein